MTAGELTMVVGAVLVVLAFTALVVTLLRVRDALGALRAELATLRDETTPLLAELSSATSDARAAAVSAREDLARFDRVLGSAEAISDAVERSGRATRTALSVPVIKAAGLATGTSRAVRRLRSGA